MSEVKTIPVHIIAGFLGAGKTTLMNHFLRSLPEDCKAAIIVNDFGKVAVDAELIDCGSYAMKELSSGCVCCTLAGPLTDSLKAIAEEQQPDLVVMETTGIAEPAQIAALMDAGAVSALVHVGNVVCVIDSSAFAKYEPHFDIIPKQVEQANTLVVNKVDLADAPTLERVRSRVAFLAQPDALVVETEQCELDPATLYDERPAYFPLRSSYEHHGHGFNTCTVDHEGEYVLQDLLSTIEALDDSVIRAKGVVNTDSGPVLIQKSLSGLDVTKRDVAPEISRLVFVGQAMDRPALEAGLEACRS